MFRGSGGPQSELSIVLLISDAHTFPRFGQEQSVKKRQRQMGAWEGIAMQMPDRSCCRPKSESPGRRLAVPGNLTHHFRTLALCVVPPGFNLTTRIFGAVVIDLGCTQYRAALV